MNIHPINFTGTKVILDSAKMGRDSFWNEVMASGIMREKAGVDIPVIGAQALKAKEWRPIAKYETKGDVADVNMNPIDERHFETLFCNLFLIDKTCGYHDNLGLNSVYFAEDGGVEFTNFRYLGSYKISKDDKFYPSKGTKLHSPKTFMPSNAENFEERGLSMYLRQMKSEVQKYNFMKKYLIAKSEFYNSERLDTLTDAGFDASCDAVRYEDCQAKVFSNPQHEVIKYNLEKMEIFAKKQEALLAWKDGNGLVDGILRPKKRFNAIIMLLDCLKESVKLKEKAELLSMNVLDDDVSEYFRYEKEQIGHFAGEVLGNIKIRGEYNFNDKNYGSKVLSANASSKDKGLYLGFKESLNAFERLYSKIDLEGSYDDALDSIEDVIKHYSKLIESWTPALNGVFREDYVA